MSKIRFQVNLNGETFTCLLDKKSRKNLNVRIKPENIIHISKPRMFSEARLISYLKENAAWIVSKSIAVNKTFDARNSYINADSIIIFDKKVENLDQAIKVSDLKGILMDYVSERKVYYDHLFQVNPTVEVKVMKGRWGSCTPALNKIVLNEKLVHYPKKCIDYVIVHEYAHLFVPNHSKDFYAVVKRVMPDYKDWVNYLKVN